MTEQLTKIFKTISQVDDVRERLEKATSDIARNKAQIKTVGRNLQKTKEQIVKGEEEIRQVEEEKKQLEVDNEELEGRGESVISRQAELEEEGKKLHDRIQEVWKLMSVFHIKHSFKF